EVRERTGQGPNNSADTTLNYAVDDHRSGFPVIRHETRSTESASGEFGKGKSVYEIDFEMSIDDRVADSEFTLSAFGLPEPIGVTWKKPTPRYVWLLLGTAACAGLTVGCRFLARRAGRMN